MVHIKKKKTDSTEIEYILTYFSTLLIFLIFANLSLGFYKYTVL